MLKIEDIRKLADLSRINIDDSELETITKEVDSILGFVSQVSSVVAGKEEDGIDIGDNINVLREDENPNESGEYTDLVLREAPRTEKGFIKVKKIL